MSPKRSTLIPTRWIISTLGIYSCALLFGQRSSLSVAIVSMTRGIASPPPNTNPTTSLGQWSTNPSSYYCKDYNDNTPNNNYSNTTTAETWMTLSPVNRSSIYIDAPVTTEGAEFDWNETLQGVVLGSSFYLYVIGPTIAGRITDSIGGKWVAFVGVLLPCILTALIPVAVRSLGVGALIALQTLIGGFHGALYPALISLFTRWFPAEERSAANGGIIFGGSVGNSVMYAVTGYLCSSSVGWPLVFYVVAGLHVPWLLLWLYYVTNDPRDNPRISDRELLFLKENVPQKANKNKVSVPWTSIVTSAPVWTSVVTKTATAFGYFMLLAKMPSFLSTVFGVAIEQNGMFSALATCSAGISAFVAPPMANLIIGHCSARCGFKPILVRKVFQTVAMVGPGVALFAITHLECNLTAVLVAMFVAMFCYGLLTGGEFTVISDFAPNFAGTVMGVVHLVPNASGIVGPYMVGAILDSQSITGSVQDRWNIVFYITTAIFVGGSVVFCALATDRQQEWDARANVDYTQKHKEGDIEGQEEGKGQRQS